MLELIPSFGGFLSTVAVFIVALSIIVAVHEYGHYIVGRWCGIHAEVFSLGFGPVLASRVDRHGTRWQIAALPFGGFVKFLGDADAASHADAAALARMDGETRKRTMHGAALYKRALTVAAGPAANFLMSIVVFAGMFMATGIATEAPVVGELKPLPVEQRGLQKGDRILALDGQEIADYEALFELARERADAATMLYDVERAGQRLRVEGPNVLPPLITAVQPQSAAVRAGLRVGDVILAVDGQQVNGFGQLPEIVEAAEGREITLSLWREGTTLEVALSPRVVDLPDGEGGFERRVLIGITGGPAFAPETRTPGPLEAIGMGAGQVWNVITTSLSGLQHMIVGAISTCNLQGPIGIAQVTGDAASQGLSSFIWFVALLSTAIGLLNLFPIPVLDGGHLVFHAYEAVAGRPPSDRAMNVMMMAGLVVVISLMVFGLTNDLFCR